MDRWRRLVRYYFGALECHNAKENTHSTTTCNRSHIIKYIIHSELSFINTIAYQKMMPTSWSGNLRRLLAVVLIVITLPVACVSRSAGEENDRILLVRSSSAGEFPSDERTDVSPSLLSDRPLKGERSRRTLSGLPRVLKLEEEPVPKAGEEAPALKAGDGAPTPKTGDAPPPKASLAKAKEGKSKKKASKSKKSAKAAKVVSDVHFHYSSTNLLITTLHVA
jgi:hypothetical protein